MGDRVGFEAMVELIQKYEVERGLAQVAVLEKQLESAKARLEKLRVDDSTARELVIDLLSMVKAMSS